MHAAFLRNWQRTPANHQKPSPFTPSSGLPYSLDSATLIQIRKKTTRQPISRKSQKSSTFTPQNSLMSVSNSKLIAPITLSFSTYKLETLAINSSFCFVLFNVQLVFDTFTYALLLSLLWPSTWSLSPSSKSPLPWRLLQLDPKAHITHRSATGSCTLLLPAAYCLSFILDSEALE